MSRTYIGIDPGKKGFIAILKDETARYVSISDTDLSFLADSLRELNESDEVVAVMEEVHALYNSSAKSTFEFGKIFGQLLGILISLKIKYILVPPKTWQKDIWINTDKVKTAGKVDTKATSINSARRLFPNVDFRRTTKCAKVDDNKVDSTLIAEYARRRNL